MGEPAKKIVPNTPEWFQERRNHLGASDAPCCLGFSRWQSPLDTYLSKVEEVKRELTPAMHRGLVLEPVILKAYEKVMSVELLPTEFVIHPEHEWMAATPDAFVKDAPILVQAKTSLSYMKHEWGEEEGDPEAVPEYYYVQVAHEMAVTDTERADLAILFTDEETFGVLVYMVEQGVDLDLVASYVVQMDFRIYPIKRDTPFEVDLIAAEKEFWDTYVVTKTPPPEIEKIKDSGAIHKASTEEECLVGEAKEAWLQEKRGERDLEVAKTRLKELIGEDSGVDAKAGKILWKKNKDSEVETIDWEALAKSLGATTEQIEEHTSRFVKPGPRVFRWPWRLWQKDLG